MANSTIESLLDFDAEFILSEAGRTFTYTYAQYDNATSTIQAIVSSQDFAGKSKGASSEYNQNLADRIFLYVRRTDLDHAPEYMDTVEDDELKIWDVLKYERCGCFWKITLSSNERSTY